MTTLHLAWSTDPGCLWRPGAVGAKIWGYADTYRHRDRLRPGGLPVLVRPREHEFSADTHPEGPGAGRVIHTSTPARVRLTSWPGEDAHVWVDQFVGVGYPRARDNGAGPVSVRLAADEACPITPGEARAVAAALLAAAELAEGPTS